MNHPTENDILDKNTSNLFIYDHDVAIFETEIESQKSGYFEIANIPTSKQMET